MNLATIAYGHVLEHDGAYRWSGVDSDGRMLDGRLASTDLTSAREELELLFAQLATPRVELEWSEADDRLEFHVHQHAREDSIPNVP